MQNLKLMVLISACYLILIGCKTKVDDQFHPMVDGRNTEYQKLDVKPISLSPDVNLYIYQNHSYVWLSYDYPEGSFGTLDMVIESEHLESALNIHVSAQLGEWFVDDIAAIPDSPTSDLWWNMNGWIANALWVNGIDTISYDTPEFKIKNAEIRELQLNKERFGRGEWRIKMSINAIKGEDGDFYSFDFPSDSTYYALRVN